VIRQAHTYLVGAVGGATLIALAIVVFAVLVSAQVFRDWPIAALGDGGDEGAVSAAREAPGGSVRVADAAVDIHATRGSAAGPGALKRQRARKDSAGDPGSLAAAGGGLGTTDGQGATETGEAGSGVEREAGTPTATGSPQSPSSPAPSGNTGTSSSGGGSGGNGGGTGTAGGGGSGTGSGTASSPTGQVTETVNNTVTQVDEAALGGTLGNNGVTGVTEGVVNGVAGPESVVGKVVDETVGAVGGLLGGGKR
jgi:hypothetical protein